MNASVAVSDALAYYAHGWYPDGQATGPGGPLRWDRPPTRCVVDLQGATWARFVAQGRRQAVRRGFDLRWDTAFEEVVKRCAVARKPGEVTWIDDRVSQLYRELHGIGAAHSMEVWSGPELVGGLVGLKLGRAFLAESIFHAASYAGHASVVALCDFMTLHDCRLCDLQDTSAYARQMGGYEVERAEYLRLLAAALEPS